MPHDGSWGPGLGTGTWGQGLGTGTWGQGLGTGTWGALWNPGTPYWGAGNSDAANRRLHNLVERLLAKRRAPGEEQEAAICWGGTSTFTRPPSVATNLTVDFPEKSEDDPPTPPITFTAIGWDTEDIRVENPDDSDQYVMVRRVKTVRYRASDGKEYLFDNQPIWADLAT